MKVRGLDLSVRVSGERGRGPTLLWGHSLLGSMAQDDDAALLPWAELAQQAELVRYDARGHGGSEATLAPADYRWTELAADLWAIGDAVAAERLVLGGVSMGCATALHAAVLDPERVTGLVLMAPPTAWRTRPRQARVYRFGAALIERAGLAPFRWMGSLTRLQASGKPLAAMQASVMKHLAHADPRAVAAAMRGAAESDLPEADALRVIRAPALILAWPGDPTHPLSTAKRLLKLLPDAELHVARTSKELRRWGPELRRFLAGLPGADSASPADS